MTEWIKQAGSDRLLLIFSGWGCDASAFEGIMCGDYDIAVVSDPAHGGINAEAFRSYSEVVLMAWSLGVYAAERLLAHTDLPLTLTIAVNGTSTPVDDLHGIPAAIFHGTLNGLTEPSLLKFRRRMGGASLPRGPRSIDSLKEGLQWAAEPSAAGTFRWDKAVIASGDLIFPPDNQRRAWQGADVVEIHDKHLPRWQPIIDTLVVDKALVRNRFSRGMATYAAEADAQRRVADHLWQLWQKHRPARGESVLEVGCGHGEFTALYAPKLRPNPLMLWDLLSIESPYGAVTSCDAETAIRTLPDASLQAIVSSSTVQWFNSVPEFLRQCARVLAPGGMLVLATYGPDTFAELTEAGLPPLPYLSLDALRRALPKGVELLELHGGKITRVFPTPMDVFRHLQATGVNARRSDVPLRAVLSAYPLRPDGRAPLTYAPVYLLARKP